jgi:CubicO group peptidase (beta-lactamase class C family)
VAAPGTRPARPNTALLAASRRVDFSRIDQLLQEYTADSRVHGAIALVMRDGKVVYRKAFGLDDLATKTPAHGPTPSCALPPRPRP